MRKALHRYLYTGKQVWLPIFIVVLFILSTSCSSSSQNNISFETTELTITTASQTLSLTAEIADTEEKRNQGLMKRTSLADDEGMLFVFESEEDHAFWMKDTYLSLDILFINKDKEIVYIEENTIPQSTEALSSNENILYALEVNAGYASQNGVNVGDRISF